MNLVERAKNIILKPKEEWVKIKPESTSVAQLFMGYAALLAVIPAAATFLGLAFIGVSGPLGIHFRWPVGSALLHAIVSYVLGLVAVYVLGLIINALAPSFGSKANQLNAMKLAVYSMTPAWIAGIFYIIPVIGLLAALASLYGLYVLYLGFATPLMDTPKDKVMGHFIVSLIVAVVLMVVVGVIVGAIGFGTAALRGF